IRDFHVTGVQTCALPICRSAGPARAATGATLTSPMQGTIVKVAVEDGATVAEGDLIVVLEAMKMEQPLVAHRAGVVSKLAAQVGDRKSVGEGKGGGHAGG